MALTETNTDILSRKDHVWALPLLRTIVTMGGQGVPKDVIARIKSDYQNQLSEQAWEWVIETNRIKWTRQALVTAGLLEKTNGIWSISHSGREWLKARALDVVDLSSEKPTNSWLNKTKITAEEETPSTEESDPAVPDESITSAPALPAGNALPINENLLLKAIGYHPPGTTEIVNVTGFEGWEIPVLQILSKGPVQRATIMSEIEARWGNKFTPGDRRKLPNGSINWMYRVQWSLSNMKGQQEVLNPQRGLWEITEKGLHRLQKELSAFSVDKFQNSTATVMVQEPSATQVEKPLPPVILPASSPQNLILYGPPGTGKTYQVKNRALTWIGCKESTQHRSEINRKFAELLKSERIEFVTFHQSYGYEDFVEGIRPITVDGQVVYRVQDGVFKRMAKRAQAALEGGFDARWDAVLLQGERDIQSKGKKTYRLRPEVATDSLRVIDTPEKTYLFPRERIREIWDRHHGKAPAEIEVTDENFGSSSTYKWIIFSALSEISISTTEKPQYVLIIDEINRGNISKIFGELITLLEPDKRLGGEDELTVRLPVSGERFGVPPNLHVLGTMNTADRSIALLDIALRRRFKFTEVMPDVSVLRDVLEGTESVELVTQVFEKLNERIVELYDRDHQLGHALFMKAVDLDALKGIILDSVIPLLREYFYGEPEKIVRIFGESKIFIQQKRVKVNEYGEERGLFDVNPEFVAADSGDLIEFFGSI